MNHHFHAYECNNENMTLFMTVILKKDTSNIISYYVQNSTNSVALGISLQNIMKNGSCKKCSTLYKVKMFYFITILLTFTKV